MKFAGKRKYKTRIIILIAIIGVLVSVLYIPMLFVEPFAHIYPDYPKTDIRPILEKEILTESDFGIIYRQTGLGKPAVNELRSQYTNSDDQILGFQEKFFGEVKIISEKNSPISKEDSLVNDDGELVDGIEFASIRNGDILITKSSHTFWWKHGHAAIIVDAANGITLESVVLGTNSAKQDISKWRNYPNFILLRLKDAPHQLTGDIAKTAAELLADVPYDLLVGIVSSKNKDRDNITGTHCSHLVWQAFALFGYDLDSDQGIIVTPKDIANSPFLEVVQVYGVHPDEIWP